MANTKLKIKSLSLIWGLVIVSAAAYARPMYHFLLGSINRDNMPLFIGLAILVCLVLLLTYSGMRRIRWAGFLSAIAALAGLYFYLDLPEEKIHILLFGSLGVIRGIEKRRSSFALNAIFILCFSLLSEGFQAILPDRVADIRDIVIDTICGVMGLVLIRSLRN